MKRAIIWKQQLNHFVDLRKNYNCRGFLLGLCLTAAASALQASPTPDILNQAHSDCLNNSPPSGFDTLRSASFWDNAEGLSALTTDALLVAADCYQSMGMKHQLLLILQSGLARTKKALREAANDETKESAQESAEANYRAEFLWRMGEFHLRGADSAQARTHLLEALERISPEDPQGLLSKVHLALGGVDVGDENYSAAEVHFRSAATAAEKRGQQKIHIAATLNRARALIDAGNPDAVLPPLKAAHRATAALADSSWKAQQTLAAAQLYHQLDIENETSVFAQTAVKLISTALDFVREHPDMRTESTALGLLGSIAERSGDIEKALAYTRLAVMKAQQAVALDELYRWQWQAARLLESRGDTDLAIAAYQQSIDTLEEIRPELTRGSSRVFQESVAPVFFGMADLLLKQHTQSEGLLAEAKLHLVRSTIERFKVAEIQDYFDEECVVEQGPEADIERVAVDAAIIYPIIFEDRMEVLTSFRGRIKRHTANVSRAKLTKTVRAFRRGLVKRPTHRYRGPGSSLHQWLLGPVIDDLRKAGIDTLIFVSDGPLRTIPPAALYSSGRFLIEDFAVASTLGLTLTSPKPIEHSSVRVLAGGLIQSVAGFAPLPAVGAELDFIDNLYDTKELRDADFQLAPVTNQLANGRYSIVHIATHGRFERDYRESFLLTYDGRLTMDVLRQTVDSRRFKNEPLELLMLSACETAVGDDQAALGLAGIALKSGARSAVGSLWTINDFATSILVEEFYRALRDDSLTKAQALRRAQLKVLSDQRYAHPAAWSPFLLVGNWL